MRYSVARLCGGKALMTSPREAVEVNIEEAVKILSESGNVAKIDDMMLVMSWKGMEVTLYSQGKIMFHPLDDRNVAISHSNEILTLLRVI